MTRYLARRLLSAIPLLVVISFLSFLLVTLIPGGAAAIMLGSDATPGNIRELNQQLGLDRPFLVRYVEWLVQALHGDFGQSISQGVSVSSQIGDRLPATVSLVVGAMLLAVIVGIVLGLWAGMRAGSRLDRVIVVLTSASHAVPAFWVAMLLSVYLGARLKLFPASGYVPLTVSPVGWFESLILPWVALSLASIAVITRQLRSAVLVTVASDYVRAARAIGVSRLRIMTRYILRNSLVSVIPVVAIHFVVVLGASFVVEQSFTISGLGSLAVHAVTFRDLPVVQGTVLVVAVVVVVANLVVDTLYGWVNPKVRG